MPAALGDNEGDQVPTVELRTLGHIDLTTNEVGDASALIAQTKRFALFCYLSLPKPGTLHRRDTLLGVFWPETDREHGRMDLRQALAFMRRALGEDVLISRGAGEVGINPDRVWCDAAAFHDAVEQGKWAEAVELYRGEFLKGLFLSNGPEFERWLDAARAGLASAYGSALEDAADAATAEGKTRAALEYCERLVEHDRYNSRYATRLMEALVASGDPANALTYAEQHTQLLYQELGVAPPAEFAALLERLRSPPPEPATAPTLPVESASEALAEHGGRAAGSVVPEPPTALRFHTRALRGITWRAFAPASIGILLVGIALGIWVLKPHNPSEAARRPTVAVLNLQNLGAPDDSAFAVGVTEAIVTRLANIRDVRIAMGGGGFSESGLDLDLISERLGASHVLRGTLQREHPDGPTSIVRISLQLVDAADGTYLWADAFETTLADVFHIYGDIGERVAAALNVTLLEGEREALAEQPSRNPEAYEYFLVGNAYFENAFPINQELWDAVEWYERAIAADSEFALAYAKLSMAHGGLYWGWHDRSEQRLEMQQAAAETALRLQPGLAEGRLALAIHYYWADRDYERALGQLASVNDRLTTDYWYLNTTAAIHRRMGNFPEAARMFASASDMNPLAFPPALEAGDTYRVLRMYEEAHRYLDRYIAIRPSRPVTYLRKALAHLEHDGNVERAREVLMSGPAGVPFDDMIAAAARYRCLYGWDRLVRVMCGDCYGALARMDPDRRFDDYWHYYFGMALLYGTLGESDLERIYHDSTAAVLEGLIRERPPDVHYHADLGLAYAALGSKEAALREATRAVDLSDPEGDAWAGYGSIRKRSEVYAMVGEPDSAVADLEFILSTYEAAQQTGRFIDPATYVPLMRIDPIWDPIRDHPAFQELLEVYDPLR